MICRKMQYIIFLCLVNIGFNASAQSSFEIADMRKAPIGISFSEKHRKFQLPGKQNEIQPTNQTPEYFYSFTGNNKNEFQLLFSGLFLFYKFFISSQDVVSCAFSPSCSEYGILSVKKQGALKGTMNTFDRLMRCHGLTPQKYPADEKTGLLIDYP